MIFTSINYVNGLEKEYLNLLELQSLVREGLEEMFPERVWLRSEVASVSAKLGGHCYLELSQTEDERVVAKSRAVIWASKWRVIKPFFESVTGESLRPGMEILVQVQVSYSELYGFSLSIVDINPEFSLGKKEDLRRKTIKRLQDEGLMDLQKELAFPSLPWRFAVVSSEDAAGYGDFMRHLDENEFGFKFELRLFPAAMQGDACPQSVCDALNEIATCGESFDAVLILRGGGSALDLACFDDYLMARSIATCPIPVLTAVGHDRDYHICDMVAYSFLKTPTALADEILGIFESEDARLGDFASRMRLAISNRLNMMEMRVENLLTRILSSDPRNILKRGYVLVTGGDGVVVKKASSLKDGDSLRVLFADGEVEAVVRNLRMREYGADDAR